MSQSRQERRAAMRQMMKEMQKQHKQLGLSAGAQLGPLTAATLSAGMKLPTAAAAAAAPISEAKLAANKATRSTARVRSH